MKRFSTIVAGRQRCSAVAAYGREWLGGISLGDYNDGWLRGAALEQIWHSSEHQQSGSATIRPRKHHFRFHQASGATVPPLADHTLPRRVHPPSLTDLRAPSRQRASERRVHCWWVASWGFVHGEQWEDTCKSSTAVVRPSTWQWQARSCRVSSISRSELHGSGEAFDPATVMTTEARSSMAGIGDTLEKPLFMEFVLIDMWICIATCSCSSIWFSMWIVNAGLLHPGIFNFSIKTSLLVVREQMLCIFFNFYLTQKWAWQAAGLTHTQWKSIVVGGPCNIATNKNQLSPVDEAPPVKTFNFLCPLVQAASRATSKDWF